MVERIRVRFDGGWKDGIGGAGWILELHDGRDSSDWWVYGRGAVRPSVNSALNAELEAARAAIVHASALLDYLKGFRVPTSHV